MDEEIKSKYVRALCWGRASPVPIMGPVLLSGDRPADDIDDNFSINIQGAETQTGRAKRDLSQNTPQPITSGTCPGCRCPRSEFAFCQVPRGPCLIVHTVNCVYQLALPVPTMADALVNNDL